MAISFSPIRSRPTNGAMSWYCMLDKLTPKPSSKEWIRSSSFRESKQNERTSQDLLQYLRLGRKLYSSIMESNFGRCITHHFSIVVSGDCWENLFPGCP